MSSMSQSETGIISSSAVAPSFGEAISEACCLVWRLSEDTLLSPELKTSLLTAFHQEIDDLADLLGLQVREKGATSGVLLRDAIIDDEEDWCSAEDRLVRCGQLLGRWALEKGPFFKIQMGVHIGEVAPLRLGDAVTYFGEAVSLATSLSTAPLETVCVLLSGAVRNGLCALQQLRFGVGDKRDSYSLDPDDSPDVIGVPKSEITIERLFGGQQSVLRARKQVRTKTASKHALSGEAGDKLEYTMREFTDYLAKCKVDTRKYGKGIAKSLEDLYKSVVVQKTSKLVWNDGVLELHMELIRISMIATTDNGEPRELRLLSEINSKGIVKDRNQKLACKLPAHLAAMGTGLERTKLGISQFLESIFCISCEVQNEAFTLLEDTYKTTVETTASPSTPDIMTTYTIHEIDMRVSNKSCLGLDVIGLPAMQSFETVEGGGINERKMWGWRALVESSGKGDGDAMVDLLRSRGIDPEDWPAGSLAELFDEMHGAKYATLQVTHEGNIERIISVVKVWLCCRLFGVEHVAVCNWTRKKVDGNNETFKAESDKLKPVQLKMMQKWKWQEAVVHALRQRLGLSDKLIHNDLYIDEENYRCLDEVQMSKTYPGLLTRYRIHEVKAHVVGENFRQWDFLGLPDASEFRIITEKSETAWCWVPREMRRHLLKGKSQRLDDIEEKRVLPVPEVGPCMEALNDVGPCPALASVLRGRKADKDRALQAARRVRDKDYTCRHFYTDCVAAFPELVAYAVGGEVSSGRTVAAEYQRTFGALFAVFWLMRLDLDGAQSFCFGLDDDWKPLSYKDSYASRSPEELRKRNTFLETFNWKDFEKLFIDAGLLVVDGETGALGHNVELTYAMLVLTAFHDIMKVKTLLPTVDDSHDGWLGYKAGDKIHDHDDALAYVLVHHGDMLPSYASCSQEQRKKILFTQCRMEYNMGWLVQAEAPPGGLFKKFKKIITSGEATQEDVAFYFVHWLTDLAGAEPFPQDGCEKFVLKFPPKVLGGFLSSFPTVRQLSIKTETEVYEEYLQWRWQAFESKDLGPPPEGSGSIALMRLVIMAQGDSKKIVDAFKRLEPDDRDILIEEMARTGCEMQQYISEQVGESMENECLSQGPAFLVYYAPALMQKAGATDPKGTLQLLAQIFRQTRELFPLSAEQAGQTVTVHIDVIKDQQVSAVLTPEKLGDVWVVKKMSSKHVEIIKANLVTDTLDEVTERILLLHTQSPKKPPLGLVGATDGPIGKALGSQQDSRKDLSLEEKKRTQRRFSRTKSDVSSAMTPDALSVKPGQSRAMSRVTFGPDCSFLKVEGSDGDAEPLLQNARVRAAKGSSCTSCLRKAIQIVFGSSITKH